MPLKVDRRPVNLIDPDLVHVSPLWPARQLPVLAEPRVRGVALDQWVQAHRSRIEALLREHGGVLFRGFGVPTPADFEKVVTAFSTDLLQYMERSTPRSKVGSYLYTSTEYPADQVIPPHNENSYAHTWPRYIWFYCERSADVGGETSLADSREVFRGVDLAIRDRFMARGVTYVRNYRRGLGLSWQETFQTESKDAVESYCAQAGIRCRWTDDGLQTRQTRAAAIVHPDTSDWVWFNQAHLFHPTSLPPAVYRSMAAVVAGEQFPRDACYGDGEPIELDALEHVRDAYARAHEEVRWQRGDVLLLDNILIAHGRLPFQGTRRVLVSMARPSTA